MITFKKTKKCLIKNQLLSELLIIIFIFIVSLWCFSKNEAEHISKLKGIYNIGIKTDKWFIGIGWDHPEITTDGKTYRWINGNFATFQFYIEKKSSIKIVIEGWTYNFKGLKPQFLAIFINNKPISLAVFQKRRRKYTFNVSANAIKKGINFACLEFKNTYIPNKIEKDSLDYRNLSGAITEIRIY